MKRWLPLGVFALYLSVAQLAFSDDDFQRLIRPILNDHCIGCHSTEAMEGELDLQRFTSLGEVKRETDVWLGLLEQVSGGEMPPKDKPPLSANDKATLLSWVRRTLDEIARANAGDPGEVVLRRLSKVEYTYTIRDLTGIDSIDPAAEFPLDGAAGEGFTNAGGALVMSPSLLTKYIDAAKDVSQHAVLLPDSIRFSSSTSSSDWANERLDAIRTFYSRFVRDDGATAVNLQGVVFDTNSGGRLPVGTYLSVLQTERKSLEGGERDLATIARETGLNEKYLTSLWRLFSEPQDSLLLRSLKQKWDAGELTVADIRVWQDALWRLTSVGHIGKLNGPTRWQEPVYPLVSRHEMRVKLGPANDGDDVVVYLSAGDGGDGGDGDLAVWDQPRLIAPGQPDLPLRDLRSAWDRMVAKRRDLVANTAAYLAAVDEAQRAPTSFDPATLAEKHQVDRQVLDAWLAYLGVGAFEGVKPELLLSGKLEGTPDYNFVKGWVGADALSVLANSSDADVRVPGLIKAHGVVAHPSPTVSAVIAWRSPVSSMLSIEGELFDAHPECGNGVTWSLELWRGRRRDTLANGTSNGATPVSIGSMSDIHVSTGDVIAFVIGPRDGDHSCDTTSVNLRLSDGDNRWDLAKDVSANILMSNPLPDSYGNASVWHFCGESTDRAASPAIPRGSLLHAWANADNQAHRETLAGQIRSLLENEPDALAVDSPDALLRQSLLSFRGPLLASQVNAPVGDADPAPPSSDDGSTRLYGLDPSLFGNHPIAGELPPGSICVQAPSVIELRLPAEWVEGMELVVGGYLHPSGGGRGSVQMQVLSEKPVGITGLATSKAEATTVSGLWSDNNLRTIHSVPVIVDDASEARQRFEAAFDDFRQWFPGALCYTEIVPVDEVVTLTLFYREDDHLKRLMLDDAQAAELDRLWDELYFVSEAPLKLVDAFDQIYQYATQDADPSAFEPMREPIRRAAAEFADRRIAVEPAQLEAAVGFAGQAWRRPLSAAERHGLENLYTQLRSQDLTHDAAIRTLIARTLVAPAFLYRGENAGPGADPTVIDSHELATRLSYFLWSSTPDQELRALADSGQLADPAVLTAQIRRMTGDPKIRRLATEFGCQWLHVRDLDTLDEKSERHFPTFVGLRDDMQEEIIRFFIDLFQADRSVLALLDADHTFVNGPLAEHYGLPVTTDDWRRVDGMRDAGRGGILGFAGTLARQSGASRTSPILRGNWLSEVVLGERLPRPPKDVPVLPDEAPEGLSERQLIERHSSDPACASCHLRIDPLGFALEGFDAIGRKRDVDATGQPIDTFSQMSDGTELSGLDGIRVFLLEARRDDFVRQFCRKLLGYSLGRAVQLSDKPLIDKMMSDLEANDYRTSVAIDLIVSSPQFRMIRGQDYLTNH